MPKEIQDPNNPNQRFIVSDDVTEEEAKMAIQPYMTPVEQNPKIQALQQVGQMIGNISNQYSESGKNIPSPAGAMASGRFFDNLLRDIEMLNRENIIQQKQQNLNAINNGIQQPSSMEEYNRMRAEQIAQDKRFLQDIAKRRMDYAISQANSALNIKEINARYSAEVDIINKKLDALLKEIEVRSKQSDREHQQNIAEEAYHYDRVGKIQTMMFEFQSYLKDIEKKIAELGVLREFISSGSNLPAGNMKIPEVPGKNTVLNKEAVPPVFNNIFGNTTENFKGEKIESSKGGEVESSIDEETSNKFGKILQLITKYGTGINQKIFEENGITAEDLNKFEESVIKKK